MKEIYMGQSTLTNNSRLWIPYQGGEKVVFLNVNSSEGATMSYELGKRKSIFNNITECRAKNPFQDECEVYSMEYEFVTATSVDKKGTLTYSLERGQKDKKFYDELKLRVQYYGSSEVNMVLQVYNDTGTLDKNCDFVAYPNTIKLGNKSFSDVYVKKVGSQEVYYTKKQGVVAFKVDGTNLWVKQ
jgi:hypothetical protein